MVWTDTHPKYNNRIAWFCSRYLYTFPCLDLLFCRNALYATYQLYRKEVLQDNSRSQVDVVTCAWHCVSTCFFIIYLLHLSNYLWKYRDKQINLKNYKPSNPYTKRGRTSYSESLSENNNFDFFPILQHGNSLFWVIMHFLDQFINEKRLTLIF